MNRDALLELVTKLAEPLVPIVGKAINGLLEGKSTDEVLTRAERDLLAEGADQAIDKAFGVSHRPNTGE